MDIRYDYDINFTEKFNKEHLDSLKRRITKDPWNQELYTLAIRLASTQNDFNSLDYLKKEFYKHCTPDVNFWLLYIEEKKLSSTKDEILHLYDLAVKNYPSSYIWLSYLSFVYENCHTFSDYSELRNLFESCLDDLGHHSLNGPQLWSEYRHFEQKLLNKVPKEEYGRQIDRIRSLFYRQLQIPLAGLPDLLDEYLVWEGELPQEYQKPTTEGEEAHKRGFDAWEQRKCFEFKIQSDFHEMMSRDNKNSLWNDYIDFELKSGDMARIMMVYHRALGDLGYDRDDLWINYANYALQTNYAKSLAICERACRHMPRSMNIWINYFLVVSSKSENVQDILDLLEKSTSAVKDLNHKISLHITAADCVRRVDFKDIVNCRYVLSKCASDLDPKYKSRAVYRLFTYWSKYELKLLSFNLDTEYIKVVDKLLERFKIDSFSWIYLIDTIKGLNPESPHISNTVNYIYKGYSSLLNFTSELVPTNLHSLIMWLYELSLTVLNANDLAEEYIDYVQSSGVVEDIKRAHKVVATHSTPLSGSEGSSRPGPLSLTNLVKDRYRKVETFSETSSDSGSYSSIFRKHRLTTGLRSPSLSTKDGELLSKSPKLAFKEHDSKSPILGCKDTSNSDDESKSGKITLKDFETVTRATWFGGESSDPSLAPAVPPNAPMPPPSSPVLSRITSRLSNSGSCSPDLTPELKFTKGSDLPPPLVLSSAYSDISGGDTTAKLCDSASNSEYKLNFSTADSESMVEPMSSDTDSQTDRFESPLMNFTKDLSHFSPEPTFSDTNTNDSNTNDNINNNDDDSNTNPGFWSISDGNLDTSLGGGHFLLKKKDCVMNWLSKVSESCTVFVSGFDTNQIDNLQEFFSKQTGFMEFRQAANKPFCYVEFFTENDAEEAIEASRTYFADYPTLSVQFSRPTKPLFEEYVVFVKVFNNEYSYSKLKSIIKQFFRIHGYEPKHARVTKLNSYHKMNPNNFESLEYLVSKSGDTEISESMDGDSTSFYSKDDGHNTKEEKPKDEDNENDNNDQDYKDYNDNVDEDDDFDIDILGCYVEFDFENASRNVIYNLINKFGWPIYVDYEQLRLQVLPSIPMISRLSSYNRNPGNTESLVEYPEERRNELYICNLNYSTDENGLKKYLEENFGIVKNLKICRDRQGNSKGYAFVEFLKDNTYSKLFEKPLVLDNRKLYVSKTKSQSPLHSENKNKNKQYHSQKPYESEETDEPQKSEDSDDSKADLVEELENMLCEEFEKREKDYLDQEDQEDEDDDHNTEEKPKDLEDLEDSDTSLSEDSIIVIAPKNRPTTTTSTTNEESTSKPQDDVDLPKQKDHPKKEGNRGRYKKRYKKYKNKVVETYTKLKKKIKLN